jgi:3-hydroxyacyl-[acyl-carrier-protein] dehydratase
MKNIEDLIPHRKPFLFVDEIVHADGMEIRGYKKFECTEEMYCISKPASGMVPAPILLEGMAQCGGAGVRLLGITEGLFALARIDNAQFKKPVHFGDTVKFVVRNIKLSQRIIKQSGIVYLGEEPAVEASWTCIKMNA